MCKSVSLPAGGVVRELVAGALREDVGGGDLSAGLVEARARAVATLFCREGRAVLCGRAWFEEAFRQVDAAVEVRWLRQDGDTLAAGDAVCCIAGRARALLTAERVAINLLQTLSATATVARRYVDAAAGAGARITDTRKTVPGLRRAQKYAAAVGGARNHRIGLFDQVLIKENHIAAAGGIAEALRRAREVANESRIEIEVENLTQLREALTAGATRIMLDNFGVDALREAVAVTAGRAELEASGNITLDDVREIAQTGVDLISIGALTKHIQAVDFSLRFDVGDVDAGGDADVTGGGDTANANAADVTGDGEDVPATTTAP
ncbi:MAG: carboxylating nicotinate-nucleotide diphosphorylase [Gammaproteobacteria bacterium]|nr:carboxylating nicotinate-nucleotide diphosphorylase [Gammaproteobacteria bacterium]